MIPRVGKYIVESEGHEHEPECKEFQCVPCIEQWYGCRIQSFAFYTCHDNIVEGVDDRPFVQV